MLMNQSMPSPTFKEEYFIIFELEKGQFFHLTAPNWTNSRKTKIFPG